MKFKTLREQLSQKEVLPLKTILQIGVQAAEALAAAHQAGIQPSALARSKTGRLLQSTSSVFPVSYDTIRRQ